MKGLSKWLMLAVLVGQLTSVVSAQTCDSEIDETTPEADFVDNENGTLTHSPSQLMWMRCSIGQTWDGTTCTGEAQTFTWQQALQQAKGFAFAEQNDWRLPNAKEMTVLVERQCVRPAVNGVQFPATPADDFWTSTPSVANPGQAWSLAFFNGSNALRDKDQFLFIRLVRTAN